jgi:hypothetical protein
MDAVPFEEQKQIIADSLSDDLQTHLLGQPIGDGGWISEHGKDGHRVTVLAGLIFALKGAYQDIGISRWFERPRSEIGGRAPVDILTGHWNASEPDVQAVLRLALFHAGPGVPPPRLH